MCRGCCARTRGCFDAGWGFVALGVLLIITAFLLGVIYFGIRAVTTSLEHIDIVPTYATALLICCAGILIMFLYKRRDPMITIPALVLSLVCLALSLTSVVLLGTKVIRNMHEFHFCRYDASKLQCHCYLERVDNIVDVPPPGSEFIYSGAPSCDVIETTLVAFAHTQCGLYALAFLLCNVSATVITCTVYNDRKVAHLLEEEADLAESSQCDNWPEGSLGRYHQLSRHNVSLPGPNQASNARLALGLCGPSDGHHDYTNDLATGAHPGDGNFAQNPIYQEIADDNNSGSNDRATTEECEAVRPPSDTVQADSDTPANVDEAQSSEHTPSVQGTTPGQDAQRRPSSCEAPEDLQPSVVLWDGYCLSPVGDSSNGNIQAGLPCRERPRRTHSTQSFSNTRGAIRPPPQHRNPRRPSRQRSRNRESGTRDRSQPQPTLFSVPLPVYRSNPLVSLGVSPFPMEPPPPYRASPPPPYFENQETEYRPRREAREARESLYYNIPQNNSRGRSSRI